MKTITEQIRKLESQQRECYSKANKLGDEIKLLKEKKKKVCPHLSYKIVDQSYMEEGRMSRPARWKEKVCTNCGKVLATSSEETKIIWSDDK